MKSFFLYTLATIGVAALTFFLILVSAPPVMGSVEPRMQQPVKEKVIAGEWTWMKALKSKMESLAAQVANNTPEPILETEQPDEETSDCPSSSESDWFDDVTPGDVASFSSYQSPTPYGRKVEKTLPVAKTISTGQSARLKQFLSNGGSGGFNGGGNGGSVAAGNQVGTGRDNSGLSDYRDSLIAVLLKSLSEKEMEELMENQTARQNAQAKK